MQQAKETYVVFGCAYCHGVTLTPRGEAADLMHSALVGADTNGDTIAALLRAGIPRTAKLSPMPQFSDLSDRQLHDIARYIHYARQQGRYREIVEAKTAPGDPAAGGLYFAQNCSSCHAARSERHRQEIRCGHDTRPTAEARGPRGNPGFHARCTERHQEGHCPPASQLPAGELHAGAGRQPDRLPSEQVVCARRAVARDLEEGHTGSLPFFWIPLFVVLRQR